MRSRTSSRRGINMNSQPQIISSEEILRKYNGSNIESILNSFKKINREHRNFKRRTEIYLHRQTRRKMLVKVFWEREDGTEEMCVTWLVDNEMIYISDRPS